MTDDAWLEIASALSVGKPTVSRWKNGVIAPPPTVRRCLRQWLLKRMEEST